MARMRGSLLAVLMVSAATLLYEITLTRVFAVAQWYHLGFLSIGVALLGFGASGSYLARRSAARAWTEASLATWCLLFSASVVGSYLAINYLPFDSYRVAWEPVQIIYLFLYYLALIWPFFFSGLITGSLLSDEPASSHAIYATNLVGSAIGSLSIWLAIPLFGESGAVIAAALLGAIGAVASLASNTDALGRRKRGVSAFCLALWSMGLLAGLLWRPAILQVRLSPYKPLSQALRVPEAEITFRASNVFSRVEVIESPAIRSAPGLSLSYDGVIPSQIGLLIDGGHIQPITRWQSREDMRFASYLPDAAVFAMAPAPRVLILNPGGGLAVQLALASGAGSVVAVEANPLAAQVVRDAYGEFSGGIYRDPRVTVVNDDGRAFLKATDSKFDVILVPLSDPFRPVASGAYSLSEDYGLTMEAMAEALRRLAPGGVLAATRWLQYPPSEGIRLAGLIIEALAARGIAEASEHLAVFRGWSTLTVLARPDGFGDAQIAKLRGFLASRQFDWVHYPGMAASEANRFHVYPSPVYHTMVSQMLSEQPRKRVFAEYAFDITPPSDDRPFFFHFFRWRQIPDLLRRMGKMWEPFGGSGYLVLLLFLVLAALISLVLIVLPLGGGGLSGLPRGSITRVVVYFAGIGLGYLFLELALIQQLVLFLGKPIHAFSTVLFTLLSSSGLGSLFSPRISRRRAMWGFLLCALGALLLLPRALALLLGLGLPLKLALTVVALAPLGFFMGQPMAQGLQALGSRSARLRAWAWGINGCASVLASVLAMLLALSWGYAAVMLAGIAAYAIALLALHAPNHVLEAGSSAPAVDVPG